MALLLPLLLSRIALILVALITMAVISYLAGYGWCASAPPLIPGNFDNSARHLLVQAAGVCWLPDSMPH